MLKKRSTWLCSLPTEMLLLHTCKFWITVSSISQYLFTWKIIEFCCLIYLDISKCMKLRKSCYHLLLSDVKHILTFMHFLISEAECAFLFGDNWLCPVLLITYCQFNEDFVFFVLTTILFLKLGKYEPCNVYRFSWIKFCLQHHESGWITFWWPGNKSNSPRQTWSTRM